MKPATSPWSNAVLGRASLAQPHDSDAAPAAPPLARKRAFWRQEWFLFLLFVAPNFFFFAVFSYWPMISNVYLSMVRWDMISPVKTFVGGANFAYLFGNDTFRTVLKNSFVFTVGAVGGALLLGLAAALLLNQPLRGRNGARAVLFAPTLLSGAAIGIVWVYIFDPRFGLLAQILKMIGISSPNWLTDPNWAMPAVIIVYVWKNVGFSTVIYLAGLQAIPKDLYEAARLDGAGVWWRFRSVTLPMLSPITFFLVITSLLNSFQAFDIIKVMTDGGPVNATNTLIYYVYEQGFVAFNAGRAAAAALVLFVIMFGITLLQLRQGEERVHYG
ncbi:MAG: sugar ABC transporter permease [Thermomicrobiales bacterium]|nr:sugar ABC transporter permease [Thermomicrobiales bacterium]